MDYLPISIPLKRLKKPLLAWKYLYTAITGCHRKDSVDTVRRELIQAIKTNNLLAYVAQQQSSSIVKDLREVKTKKGPTYPSRPKNWEEHPPYTGNPIILLIENLESWTPYEELRENVALLLSLGLYSKAQIAVIATVDNPPERMCKRGWTETEQKYFGNRWNINLAKPEETPNVVSIIKTAKLLRIEELMDPA